jgi:serine/threonine protein phosphatase PrpC
MRIVSGASTDTGQVRDGNEDSYLVDRRLELFAVADGMGGHRAGEIASATALDGLKLAVDEGHAVADAVGRANTAVWDKAAGDTDLAGMGTTLTAAIFDDATLTIAHVGDSRAYLLRDDRLERLTTDHSLVEELIRDGKLTEDQAAVHPQRSIITRALGVDSSVEVDVYSLVLQGGDRVILCSDGLTSMVRAPGIAEILRAEADPTAAANALVDAANAAGGEDNITTIVVDVEDDGADPFAPAPPSINPSVTTTTPAVLAGTDEAAPVPPTRSDVDDATAAIPLVELPDGGKSMGAVAGAAGPEATRAEAAVPARDAPARRSKSELELPEGATAAQALAARERAERKKERNAVKSAGRFARFIVPILLILGLAVGVTAWYARRTYYVDFDRQGAVTIYQGRPGGLLLWDPTVVRHSTVTRDDLSQDAQLDVEDRKEFADKGAAIAFVSRVEDRATTTTSTTTTTAPGATTSTTTTTTRP